ncbi:MAG TPA: LPS export ABC transporter permease LptG [Aliidongia sp.]|uniref:LPS export ABC transporter permease LptG n=1 Tax=Aliidongia sp. TaxID=1914230 RepID=UPI002DDD295D|nr:LPS export ABC transporter permease LptG [Aliidongia sp.]HEV2678440.1 LPS export ABC transporter permease LptG [Aliidongia sp.]
MTATFASTAARLRSVGSRILPPLERYIATAALRAFALVAAALTALFSLLEFVEQLASVGEGHYRLTDALTYVLLTAPARLLQVTPVSILLGCLLALGALGRNSELTALKSLGISERRIVGSILKLLVPIVIALFLLAEFVIPPAQHLAQTERTAALSASSPVRGDNSFWAQGANQYLNVQRFASIDEAEDIDIYAFGTDGSLENFIHADRAAIRRDGTWLLTGVMRKWLESSEFQTERLDSLSWHSFIAPQQVELLKLPPETMPPVALFRYVYDLQQRHQQAIRYEQELWRRVSIPLSMVAMILIAAPFVFGPPRGQSTGQQMTIGAIVGIVFSLTQQIAGHLDVLLDLDPAATALAPSLLLMGLAIYLFRRVHR